ncbi:hypothetical protein QJS04_geneDACA018476 [Acorus gramineus]|uniref:AB hydrolase-1 domain-containing protein n=1 Tax=Acorus gramineus TaxID=55184 RepID=A0AAV9A3M5_ACOGR|nr:hypothetical protein QJS04_geneDACA018734 [Acorus gramineus]KAK1269250.1 hypothetical protein QJS04_geneDACA018476 [Acorus gramineus]
MFVHADVRSALQIAATVCYIKPIPSRTRRRHAAAVGLSTSHRPPCAGRTSGAATSSDHPSRRLSATTSVDLNESVKEKTKKPPICTADELHYVDVSGSHWRLALWRYRPPPEAPARNHPLMLLSGVGTNAIGFDLSPGASFARHMSGQGFDTWIVEVRGAGLSTRREFEATINGNKEAVTSWDESILVTRLTDTFLRLAEMLSGYLNEGQSKVISAEFLDRISKLIEDAQLSERFSEISGKISSLLEVRQNSSLGGQIRELSERLVNIVEEGQRSVSPQLFDLQKRLSTTIEDFQKQLDLIVLYDWDFDHYLEEDVPAAMEYIRSQSKPKDGKLLAIGHSMGGILLYAMLSRCSFEQRKSGLAAVVTLASSLDYTTSRSSLKLLLPLADPAQALNIIPIGVLMAAVYPLSSRPPYVLSWLNAQVSAQDMMDPELFEKLVLNNFCTIPAKLLLQLTTAFREGGLRDRSSKFSYKDHLHNCDVPVLAIAGDQDLICPPEAVYETVKIIPQHMVTYKIFGQPNGPHYAHYDLVGGRLAIEEEYPYIIDFLCRHDVT